MLTVVCVYQVMDACGKFVEHERVAINNEWLRKTKDPTCWLETCHNQLSDSWARNLHLLSKIVNEEFAYLSYL